MLDFFGGKNERGYEKEKTDTTDYVIQYGLVYSLNILENSWPILEATAFLFLALPFLGYFTICN